MNERALCREDAIAEGTAKGFSAMPGSFAGLFAVKKDGVIRVYVNSCPHIGLPLEPLPDRFLDARKQMILCASHGARFRIGHGPGTGRIECAEDERHVDAVERAEHWVGARGEVDLIQPHRRARARARFRHLDLAAPAAPGTL